MRLNSILSLIVLVLWSWSAATAAPQPSTEAAKHWPQWRGPLQNGVAPQGDPPTEWTETKNVKWKLKIPGDGDATPIIWGDKVFVLTAIPTGKKAEPKAADASDVFRRMADAPAVTFGQVQQAPQGQQRGGPGGEGRGRGGPGGRGGGGPPTEIHQWAVICVDRNTGKVLWQKVAREEVPHEGHQQNNTYASYSPVTDGEQLYVSFGSWGVYCYDFNGDLKWHRDLGKMRSILGFGEGGSPALHDGKLVINWDHEGEDFITALDTKTGETLWKTARDERMTWTTPLIVKTDKGTQVVVPASGKTRSYDLATGKLLWECAGQTANVIPSAVTGHGLVYAISGFKGWSLQAIRYDRTGDLTDTDAVVWSVKKSTPYVPSPLLYDDLLYFFSNNNNILSCYEARTGKPLIDAQRVEGLGDVYASPVGASGRVYLVGRDGRAVVLKQGSQLESLASNKLDDRFDASPAIVGKQLFLRGHQNLYCIAE
jgi:outer membrane protein assembly factor BamB